MTTEPEVPEGPVELLLQTTARINRLQDQVLAGLEVPLTSRQYRVLARVHEGHTSPTVLSRLARRSLPTLSETVDGMVRRGLLTRTPSEQDRRSLLLGLTPAGEKALQRAADAMAALGRDLLDALPPESVPQLAAMHEQLYRLAEKYLDARG